MMKVVQRLILGVFLLTGCAEKLDPLMAIEQLGAGIQRNEMGHVIQIDLNATAVTDDVLKNLEGLVHLRFLELNQTSITDAGLIHLKGLSTLETLLLFNTNVTDAGVAELEMALPNCTIRR
ncbi:MAG: hypothetical protein VX435_07785 [Planctomycetota bacterium]|nr:hypothetical protein [Planctomycetota bacterium]